MVHLQTMVKKCGTLWYTSRARVYQFLAHNSIFARQGNYLVGENWCTFLTVFEPKKKTDTVW